MNDIVFVSGHLDITEAEFQQHYVLPLDAAVARGASFVVGDARGVDFLAQACLSFTDNQVTVFHMFDSPRHLLGEYDIKGGYTSDEERDAAMTRSSNRDIAWVRPGREKSGTAKNLARRLKLELIDGETTNDK